jgi:hypothetical protein
MFGCLRSCLGKTVALVFLLLVAYAGWRWGPAIFPRVEGWFGVEREEARRTSSPELGEEVLGRYERLLAGQGDEDELVLSDVEVESLILFGLPGLLPSGIDGPSLEIVGGELRLSGRVATEAFPRFPDLQEIFRILPDTVPLEIRASLMSFGQEDAALVVQRIDAMNVPLPRRFYPGILEAFGRRERRGLPAEAVALPLPEGLSSAQIVEDRLVLIREP